MEIVRAFKNNELNIHITIQGTDEEPLFRASDIGEVLGFNDINNTVKNFNDKEKVRLSTLTLGGKQDVNFLTEKGLYKLLFKSRKPIADKFQDWVCEIIKEIRLNGKYVVQEQMKLEHIKEIQDINYQKDKEREEILILNFKGKDVVYLIIVFQENGIILIKFGFAKDIRERMYDHRTTFGKNIVLHSVFETVYNKNFETMIKQDPIISPHIISKIFNNTNQIELIQLDSQFTLKNLDSRME